MTDAQPEPEARATHLREVRQEMRAEFGLLHERVNALLTAEAFLTIAYTSAMAAGGVWQGTFSRIASPVLAVLGLLLAVLAWPGIDATARLVLDWSARQRYLLRGQPSLYDDLPRSDTDVVARPRAALDERRSILFFRAVPVLFGLVWTALTVVALTIVR